MKERNLKMAAMALAAAIALAFILIIAAIVNRGSLKQAYDAISKISKKFKDSMGIDMDEQINLLKYVDSIKNDEAKLKSIHRIITEALTPRSPFKTFGELFDHSFFK